ncbi:MAG: hypothetical protein ACTHJW_28960 [Streptosporangiaceae bacterium]
MSNTTFRLRFGSGPIGPMAVWFILVAAVMGPIIGVWNPSQGVSQAIIVLVLCAATGSYFQTVRALSFTQCTETEIRTRCLFRTRRCPWQDVSDITAERSSRGRRPARSVVVTTTAGNRFRLGAPFDGELIRDPGFDEALAAILSCWQKVVVVAGHAEHDGVSASDQAPA